MTLKEYLAEAAVSRADFARQIDVSQETVRRYLIGTRIPDKHVMERIALATGCKVTANDFFRMVAAA
jgi:transcriptional regulator with XRE-family HTH domain